MWFQTLYSLLVLLQSIKDQPLQNCKYIPLALFCADLTGYIFHWFVDESKITGSGSAIDKIRIEFQTHHAHPKDIIDIPFWRQAGNVLPITMGLGTLSLLFPTSAPFQNWIHQYAHKRTHHIPIPDWIKSLQDYNIIISGQEHHKHHIHPEHKGHWSTFTPLSNRVLDPLFVKKI
jgi:hypothetical protein